MNKVKVCLRWKKYSAALPFLLMAALASAASKQASVKPQNQITEDGFVTQLKSPTEFYLGSLHVTMNEKTQCETQDLRSNIQVKTKTYAVLFARHSFALQDNPISRSTITTPCGHISLKIGSHVQIEGYMKPQDYMLIAAQVIAYDVEIQQQFSSQWLPSKRIGGALLEETPQVHPAGQGWTGTLWLDGYPMCVLPDETTVLNAPPGVKPVRPELPPLTFSSTLFQPNILTTYSGMQYRVKDCIRLYTLRLWPNQVDAKEKAYKASLSPTIQNSANSIHIPESVNFPHLQKNNVVKIIPDQTVQNFVSRIGTSLIPPYQKTLANTDPTKIHFRFYVVQSDEKTFDKEIGKIDHFSIWLRPSWDEATLAFPNGVILVPEHTLVGIENEAQLATILSGAITSVLQKQSYMGGYAYPSPGLVEGFLTFDADVPDFSNYLVTLWVAEQTIRIGIRQMYLAGYDIREAPFAWAVAEGKPVANPIIDSKHPDKEIPWYAAYAFNYIGQYYSDVDYSKLKRGEKEYQQFLVELRKADPSLNQPAVTQ